MLKSHNWLVMFLPTNLNGYNLHSLESVCLINCLQSCFWLIKPKN